MSYKKTFFPELCEAAGVGSSESALSRFRMIKIAYILTPVEFGGSEKVSLTFLRNVNRSRLDLRLILLVRPWEDGNVFIRQIREAGYSIGKIPVALRPRSEGADFFRVERSIVHLYRILSGQSFDLVHTHGYFADIIATPVCKLLKIPHISTCHGFISTDRKLNAYNMLDKFMLRFCDRIIAVSSEIGKELVSSGVNESKIVVIPNAIKSMGRDNGFAAQRRDKRQSLSIGREDFVIGYVGRLSEEKGVRYLIKAAEVLKEKDENFRIILLGDGQKRHELECLALSQGLDKEVLFMGFQNDIEEWLPAMDVFVLPSLTEGTPMALLEAMSLGIPVIATSVGGVPKIVQHGINGLLVEPGDYRGIAEKILAFCKDPLLRKSMGDEAVSTIQREFDVSEWCMQIERLYDEFLMRRNRG